MFLLICFNVTNARVIDIEWFGNVLAMCKNLRQDS